MQISTLTSVALAALTLLSTGPEADAQLTARGDKYLGGILKGRRPRNAPVQRATSENWHDYFNAVSPENAGKWNFVEIGRDTMEWTALDSTYNYALERGLPWTIHSIIREEREPEWLRRLPAEEIRAEVEEWIALLAERYPETTYIDVVNEAAHDRLGSDELNAAFGGEGETGWDDPTTISKTPYPLAVRVHHELLQRRARRAS